MLIKDNHVAACGGVGEAVRRARARAGAMLKIEVEVVDLPGLDAAIAAGADIVLLDNMTDEAMAAAVVRAAGRVLLEASGNMTQERPPAGGRHRRRLRVDGGADPLGPGGGHLAGAL